MSLAHKYVNLKDPYNQGIKEQVTTIIFSKNEDRHYMKSPTLEAKCVESFFKFNPLFVVFTFQIINQ